MAAEFQGLPVLAPEALGRCGRLEGLTQNASALDVWPGKNSKPKFSDTYTRNVYIPKPLRIESPNP